MSETPQKQQKFHKTIFNTTEKSNFILNMTHDQFNKFAGSALSIGLIILFLFSASAEIISVVTGSVYKQRDIWTDKTVNGFLESVIYDWRIIPTIGLSILGILSITIFIIAIIKQTITKKQLLPCIIIAGLFILMYISSLKTFQNFPNYSWFLGYRFGRYEGFLTHLCYMFLFLGGLSITDKKALKKVFDTIVLIVFLQCIWSVVQMFTGKFFSFYDTIIFKGYTGKPVINLPSGNTGSPILLAFILSIGLVIACTGAVFDSSSRRKLLFKISILPISFFLIKTQCLISMISATVILISMIILVIIKNKKSDTKYSLQPVIIMLTGFICALVIMIINGFTLYDGVVMWQDGSQRIDAFSAYHQGGPDLFNLSELYDFLWTKICEYIELFKSFGLGPDATLLPQTTLQQSSLDYKSGIVIDRPYNDYLYYAVSFGIPFCAVLISSIISTLVKGIKEAKKFVLSDLCWYKAAALICVVVYVFVSFINNASATVTPFIWLLAGICWCQLKEENN